MSTPTLPAVPEPRDTADRALRIISQRFPDELARVLLGAAQPLTAAIWETQYAARDRRLDRALDVRKNGARRLLHVEWQSDMLADVPFRLYEYNGMLAAAADEEARAVGRPPPPIQSVVVLLGGRDEPWPAYGIYRTSPEDEPFSGLHFRIVAVYQQTVAELEACRSPLWLAFAPLCVDADKANLGRVVKELRASSSPREFEDLGAALTVLAQTDGRKRGLGDVVRSLLPKELIMASSIFEEVQEIALQKGLAQGRLEGQLEGQFGTLTRVVERRLGRQLTDAERAALAERSHEHGTDRAVDMVLDLPPDALAAWLAPNSGH